MLHLLVFTNIFGSSSEAFEKFWESSEIFANFRKILGDICMTFGQHSDNVRKMV